MTKTSHDSETPAQGQQVISACAFIHKTVNGVPKVFMPKRAATKKFLPSVFELPGGHIDFGEDIAEGLKREVTEEFGMTITVGDPFAAFTYLNEVKGSHSIEVIYFAQFVEDESQITLNPEDHSEYGWYGEADLPSIADANKGIGDAEFVAIRKGFALLNGEDIGLR